MIILLSFIFGDRSTLIHLLKYIVVSSVTHYRSFFVIHLSFVCCFIRCFICHSTVASLLKYKCCFICHSLSFIFVTQSLFICRTSLSLLKNKCHSSVIQSLFICRTSLSLLKNKCHSPVTQSLFICRTSLSLLKNKCCSSLLLFKYCKHVRSNFASYFANY